MNIILLASILVVSINQLFACECGGQLATSPYDLSKYEGKLSRFQWYAVVTGKDRDSCGSALLDNQHVATAANCVDGLNADSIKVQLNDNSTSNVSCVWVDSRYNKDTGAYDFAILTLSSPVDSQFLPVCLKTQWPDSNTPLVRVSPSTSSSFESYITAYSNARCNVPVTSTHLCAVNYGREDAGCHVGPLTSFEYNRRHYLTGITSRCGPYNQAVYTDVAQYAGAIKVLAQNACWKPVFDCYY